MGKLLRCLGLLAVLLTMGAPAFAGACPAGLPPGVSCNGIENYIYGASPAPPPYSSGLRIPAAPGPTDNSLLYIPGNLLATLNDSQTLTNKTIDCHNNTCVNFGSFTAIPPLSLSGGSLSLSYDSTLMLLSGQLHVVGGGGGGGGGNVQTSGTITTGTIGTWASAIGLAGTLPFSNTSQPNTIPEMGSGGTLASGMLPAINLAVSGAGGVTGNLPVTNLNSGIGASSTTVWLGNGTWGAPPSGVNITAGDPSIVVSPSPLTGTGTLTIGGPSHLTTFSSGAVPMGAGTAPLTPSEITDPSLNGVVIGSPTGGAKGAGTLNASGLYVNNVAVNPVITWPTSGSLLVSSGGNSPTGIAPVNNDLLYSTGGAWAPLTSAINAVLGTNGSGVPSLSTTLPSGLAATSMVLTTPNIGAATGTSLSVSGQLTSTVAIGTPPLVVASTTNVPNLNASSLSGATFAAPGTIGGTTPGAATFSGITDTAITGSTQCLQANSSGVISGAGGACTTGGSGLSGMTAGQVPIAATATTITSSKALTGTGAKIASSTGTLTNGDCVSINSVGDLIDAGGACSVGGGGGTVSAGTVNRLAIYTGATTVGSLTGVASAVAVTDGSSIPSWSTTLPSGIAATNMALTTPAIGAATGASLSVTGQLTSTVATGTAPLVVSSTTNVANLNASSLSGATFAAPGAIGGTTPSTAAFTTESLTGQLTSTLATGTAPFVVASTTNVANLNASSLNGATFASPGSIGSSTPGSVVATTLSATTLSGTFGGTPTYSGVPVFSGLSTVTCSVNAVFDSGQHLGTAACPVVAGTTPQAAYYASSGSAISGNSNVSYQSGFTRLNYMTAPGSVPAAITGALLQMSGPDTTVAKVELDAFGAAANYVVSCFAGTGAAPTAVGSGVVCGGIHAWAYNGSSLIGGLGSVTFQTAQLQSAGGGMNVLLSSTPIGSTTPIVGLTLDSTQNITVAGQAGSGTRCVHVNSAGLQSTTSTDCAAGGLPTVSKTANYAINSSTDQNGTCWDNTGASGTVIFTLPAVAAGLNYCFTVMAAQVLEVLAPSGVKIAIAPSNSAAGGNIQDSTLYESVTLYVPAGAPSQWIARSALGSNWSVN